MKHVEDQGERERGRVDGLDARPTKHQKTGGAVELEPVKLEKRAWAYFAAFYSCSNYALV